MYIHKYQEKELHKEQKLKILFIFPLTFMILGILFILSGSLASLLPSLINEHHRKLSY